MLNTSLTLDDFNYTLPRARIATRPMEPKDHAKLLLSANEHLSDHHVFDLPALLHPGDLLIFNNTRVIPAQLQGKRGDVTIDVTLHQPVSKGCWSAFVKPAKRLRIADNVIFAHDFIAKVMHKTDNGQVHLAFDLDEETFKKKLAQYGAMPIPPYMDRKADQDDDIFYQTMFAQYDGAVAAPTAGLHFTPRLMHALEKVGIEVGFVTLHVGAGTFLPVRVHHIHEHQMHDEWGNISPETALQVNRAKEEGRRVIAVGTTSLRVMESAANAHARIQPYQASTDLFITPGYHFKIVDGLMTNFHLPKSTLLMLVSAFVGMEKMRAIYDHAIHHDYRFYSYGDTSLLLRS